MLIYIHIRACIEAKTLEPFLMYPGGGKWNDGCFVQLQATLRATGDLVAAAGAGNAAQAIPCPFKAELMHCDFVHQLERQQQQKGASRVTCLRLLPAGFRYCFPWRAAGCHAMFEEAYGSPEGRVWLSCFVPDSQVASEGL